MKYKMNLISCVGIVTLALCLPLAAQTMPKRALSASASPIATPSPTPTASSVKQSNRPFPFHGMVSAVDQKAKTFTITGKEKSRIFKVTDKTTMTKGAGAATMKDISENQEVSGSYWRNPDGTFEAKIVKLGPTEKAKTSASASPTALPKPSASPKP
jgi:curli biogenesis system outer membrane secretion channel CsgG